MLFGLRHQPLVGGDHQEGDVDPGGSGQHVADEALVAGHVYDARLHPVPERQGGEAKVDGDAATLLFFPAVGIDPGEGLHQRRLAVVDVPGGADYEAAIHARRSQNSGGGREGAEGGEPSSPRWWRVKRATSRRWAAACAGSRTGRAAAGSLRVRRSRKAGGGSRLAPGGAPAAAQRAHSAPPSAGLKSTTAPSPASMPVPSRAHAARDGSNPSTPSNRHSARTAAASTASAGAVGSPSSPATNAS